MSVNVSPWGPKPQFILSSGLPAVGYRLFAYVAGSVGTKRDTFTTASGLVANTNPIVLDSGGQVPLEFWWTEAFGYKIVFAPPGTDDPPSSISWSIDNLTAPASTVGGADEWTPSGITPTFVDATHFTMPGDQTSRFQVGRRLKTTITAGTGYNTITASVFGALTTVTVTGTALDAGLSAVSYGFLSATNNSIPVTALSATSLVVSGTAAITGAVSTGALTPSAITIANSGSGGQLAVATATPVTMFVSAGAGARYDVRASVRSGNYSAVGFVDHTAGGAQVINLTPIGPLVISVSGGTDIQVTQSSGGAADITWGWTRTK